MSMYTPLLTHTSLLQWAHMCTQKSSHLHSLTHSLTQMHTDSLRPHTNLFTHPRKQAPSVYTDVPAVRIGTPHSHRCMQLHYRSTEQSQSPTPSRGQDTLTTRPSSRPVGPPRGPAPPPILRPPFFLGSKRDQAAPVSSAHASCVHS